MIEFANAIKVLLEKKLVPTVAALVFGALIYAYTPIDYWLLSKFGGFVYWLVCSGIVFLGIALIQFVIRKIGLFIAYMREKHDEYMQDEEDLIYHLGKLRDYTDTLDEESIQLLERFLQNGNDVIEVPMYHPCNMTNGFFDNREVIKRKYSEKDGEPQMQCILDDHFYSLLKECKKKYGKISHFG